MKKILLGAACFFIAISGLNAQNKEGSITYAMEFTGLSEEQEQEAAMLKGMELKVFFKNGKSRADFSMAFGSTISVTDEKGNVTTVADMMGQKLFSKQSAEDIQKKEQDKKRKYPVIKYNPEKKTIASYECKKAIVEFEDESGTKKTVDVWYCEKIPYVSSRQKSMIDFKGLKGAPLEFEVPTPQGMIMKISATEVKLGSIPDSKFVVSTDGYTEMKPEDMAKRFGGGQ